jgi:flagellar protein FliO/FliZ
VKRFAALFPLVVLLADPLTALAAVKGPGEDTPLNLPSSDETARTLGTSGSSGGSLTRTFFGLLVVVAVIYGLYWVLRQVKKSREEQAKGTGLHTEATVPLGPNRALHLVRAGRELVLVGVAEHGVVPIRTYSEEEAIALGLVSEDDDVEAPTTGGPTPPPIVAMQDKVRTGLEALRARTVRG